MRRSLSTRSSGRSSGARGELEGVTYEQITYEGYAPGGVAVLVEVLTDNRNRTGSEIRSLFKACGGSMAEPGAVSWQFERQGVIVVDRAADEDELMLAAVEAGADDVADDGDAWRVVSAPGELGVVREALEDAGFPLTSAEPTMVPTTTVELDSVEAVKPVLRLVDALDDHDDVQGVYANFEIDDAILDLVEA